MLLVRQVLFVAAESVVGVVMMVLRATVDKVTALRGLLVEVTERGGR